jgi:hypothetical protein
VAAVVAGKFVVMSRRQVTPIMGEKMPVANAVGAMKVPEIEHRYYSNYYYNHHHHQVHSTTCYHAAR